MEIRQLKYFVAVANELSIARAAVQLNISQPPLTRQIQQLEEDLGAQLFVRSVKGVELTEAGRTLLADAKSVLALVDLAAERAKRASQGLIGRLDIGTFGAGVYDIVPRILRRFRSLYPEVKIVLHAMNKDQQIEALRQRRISIGFNRLVPKHPDIEFSRCPVGAVVACGALVKSISQPRRYFNFRTGGPAVHLVSYGRPAKFQ